MVGVPASHRRERPSSWRVTRPHLPARRAPQLRRPASSMLALCPYRFSALPASSVPPRRAGARPPPPAIHHPGSQTPGPSFPGLQRRPGLKAALLSLRRAPPPRSVEIVNPLRARRVRAVQITGRQ